MSMIGELREITPARLARLKADPSLTRRVVRADYGSDGAASDRDTILHRVPAKEGA